MARNQGIIVYRDSPGETVSTRAAQLLNERGYTRVAVLTGGFAAWQAASLPLERTPHGRLAAAPAPQVALPIPGPESAPALRSEISVDLPVGVKGAGPYFNARAKTLSMTSLFLATTETVSSGQKLRLTIFLKGIPGGYRSGDLCPQFTGYAAPGGRGDLDTLGEEAATILEGFILAHWSGGRLA
jgi:hypothetical protein